MKVIIKLVNNTHEQFVTGKEYEADKMDDGYFVNSGQVSKLIPASDVKEVKCIYSD